MDAFEIQFTVIDKNTGKYPEISDIALKEEWANELMYPDMWGFAVGEDGSLFLVDECGNLRNCPSERFDVKLTVKLPKDAYLKGVD